MSAWTIYWILQLDSIGFALGIVAILSGIGGLIGLLIGWIEGIPKLQSVGKKSAIAAVFLVVVIGLIPSTKTAAAMVVIPAIVNNEALKAEAGDLYQLAKQALREAVTEKPEAK